MTTRKVETMADINLARVGKMSTTAAAEDDRDLLKYYVETGTFQEMCDGGQIVLGSKGSGKTALFEHASAHLQRQGVQTVKFSLMHDFPLERQKMFTDNNVSDVERYVLGWQYTLYLAAYLKLKESGFLRLWQKGNFLRIWKRGEFSRLWQNLMLSRCYRRAHRHDVGGVLEKWLGAELDASVKVKSATFSFRRSHNSILRNDDMRTFVDAMNDFALNTRYVILIDGIDPIWDDKKNEGDRIPIIQGLLQAVRKINRECDEYALLRAEIDDNGVDDVTSLSSLARVICFLRDDIFGELSFSDRNKVSAGAINLFWSQEKLQEVVMSRVRYLCQADDASWENLVDNSEKMVRQQLPSTYLWKHTFNRPRDYIVYVACAAKIAKGDDRNKICKADIESACSQYCAHVVEEFEDEHSSSQFDFEVIKRAFREIGENRFNWIRWKACEVFASESDAERYFDHAIDRSLIGWKRMGGRGGGSSWQYTCFGGSFPNDTSLDFIIHPAIQKALQIKESRK